MQEAAKPNVSPISSNRLVRNDTFFSDRTTRGAPTGQSAARLAALNSLQRDSPQPVVDNIDN